MLVTNTLVVPFTVPDTICVGLARPSTPGAMNALVPQLAGFGSLMSSAGALVGVPRLMVRTPAARGEVSMAARLMTVSELL